MKEIAFMDFKNELIFELKSYIGRKLLNRKPPIDGLSEHLLHLGSADKKFKGWINADFFCGFKPWKKFTRPDWMLDVRYPLNCDDEVWDGIFSEHLIEHLYPAEVMRLLKELFRTMKYGAWLRITAPDLQKYVDFYGGKNVGKQFSQFATGCEAIQSLTHNYGHRSTWDAVQLKLFLDQAGFKHISKLNFLEGTDERLLKDLNDRKWESFYMEGQKI
jgi:predicted SAM-dependent methyltransferase